MRNSKRGPGVGAEIKIPYYTVRRNGRGFWEPTKHMRALGFRSVPCGPDGPDAWAIAEESALARGPQG